MDQEKRRRKSKEPSMATTGNREKPKDGLSSTNLDRAKFESSRRDRSKGEKGASEEPEQL